MQTTISRAGVQRRFAIGAEPMTIGVHFRVWAPKAESVFIILVRDGGEERAPLQLERARQGYWSGLVDTASVGERYFIEIAPGQRFPDPASRFQPEGPDGPSEIVDPGAYQWGDRQWRGVSVDGQILYEMHVGTYTREGTWRAAMAQLPELSRLGITLIEMMPVAEFAGGYGWGYDGVDLYAPTHLYGRPDDLRAFIDRAHQLGVGVILDVVYNHLGPDGCYLSKFSDTYFTKKYGGEWGDPLNFDDENSRPVREYFIENAAYWIDEYHFDGLRLDATQGMIDASKVHIVQEIGDRARRAAAGREIVLVAENEPQQTRLVRDTADGGYGLDFVWNDDFHHSAVVALTGHREAYYTDYAGTPQEFISAAKRGYLYQGQWYSWQRKPRGEPGTGIAPRAFITFLENHDQVANSARGLRLHARTAPCAWRAMTALVLLGPGTPMLFQGQEFASSAPFLYFADHKPPLAESVRDGRREFISQFPSVRDPAVQSTLPAPGDPANFERCVLDLSERERREDAYRLYRDLIATRRSDPAIRMAGEGNVDGAVLSSDVFVLRYFGGENGDRLLFVNLGCDYHPGIIPEPLLAPPSEGQWTLVWSSEHPAYGGEGTPEFNAREGWRIPGRSALYFRSEANTE
jgi:maltooligosyltrehalose trehalohydrolase